MKSWRGLKPCGPRAVSPHRAFSALCTGILLSDDAEDPKAPFSASHKDTHAGRLQSAKTSLSQRVYAFAQAVEIPSAPFSTVEVKRFSNPYASSWKSTIFRCVPCPPTWPESPAWWGCWSRSSSAARLSWWRQRVWNWTQPGSLWWAGRAAKRKGIFSSKAWKTLSFREETLFSVSMESGTWEECSGLSPQRPRLLHSSKLRQFVFSFHHFPSKLSWKCAFNWKVILFAHKFWMQW